MWGQVSFACIPECESVMSVMSRCVQQRRLFFAALVRVIIPEYIFWVTRGDGGSPRLDTGGMFRGGAVREARPALSGPLGRTSGELPTRDRNLGKRAGEYPLAAVHLDRNLGECSGGVRPRLRA